MAYCPQCGAQQDDRANFCANCGAALRPQPAATPFAVDGTEAVRPRLRAGVPGFVRDALHPSEQILGAFSASLFDHHKQGVSLAHDKFVLTNERIIFYHTGLFHKGMGEMPYRSITGVSYDRGIFHGKVIVEAANVGLTMDGIGNDDAAFAEKIIAGSIAGRRYVASGPPIGATIGGGALSLVVGVVVLVLVLGLIVNVLLPAARRIGRGPLGEAPPAFTLRYDLDRPGAWALAPAPSRRARRR